MKKQTLKTINDKGLNFIHRHSDKIIGLLIVGIVVLLGAAGAQLLKTKNIPKTTRQFSETSVMITNLKMSNGGSGVILRSNPSYSEILTNRHVCALVENGGLVVKNGETFLVDSTKKYPTHDLCLIKVYHDFKVNTKVAQTVPEDYSPAKISGHPALLPHVLTQGSFSGRRIITLMVAVKECTHEDLNSEQALLCIFLGGIPVLQQFHAQLVTGTILPGSSGSGVFNEDGEIAGLVFAGNGEGLGYAFIVPNEYLIDFLFIEKSIPYKQVYLAINDKNIINRLLDIQNQCKESNPNYKVIENVCKARQNYLIWERR